MRHLRGEAIRAMHRLAAGNLGPPLANIGEASISGEAYGTDNNWHDFATDSFVEITLDNTSGSPLMVPSVFGTDQANIQWERAQ